LTTALASVILGTLTSRWLVISAALLLACTRSPTSRAPASQPDAGDTGSDAYAAAPSGYASNGVPIPPLDPAAQCSHVLTGVEPCKDSCPPLSCDCGGTPLAVDPGLSGCVTKQCATSVSCTTACALGPFQVQGYVLSCLIDGLCGSDRDCAPPETKCLVLPRETTGTCTTGGAGARCLADADCASGACVAAPDGSHACTDGAIGAACNTDRHCQSRLRCALAAGAFTGACTDGDDKSPCVTKTDCMPLLDCLALGVAGTRHLCTAHAPGSPCELDGQCNGGFCFLGKCTTGAVGADCANVNQCHTRACVAQHCSDGIVGAPCFVDSDCVGQCSNDAPGTFGTCTTGEVGPPCPCVAGLHCNGFGAAGLCAPPTVTGGACRADADCVSGKCSGPDPVGTCTEGMLHQQCRDTPQCQPGLHCISDGLVGTCFAGLPGDPCAAAADCANGLCPLPAETFSPCITQGDFTPCLSHGVCLHHVCFPQTCAATPDAAASD
jgi:hypothetical protein